MAFPSSRGGRQEQRFRAPEVQSQQPPSSANGKPARWLVPELGSHAAWMFVFRCRDTSVGSYWVEPQPLLGRLHTWCLSLPEKFRLLPPHLAARAWGMHSGAVLANLLQARCCAFTP